MMYDLPQSLIIGSSEYEIRSDYRAVLDICTALSDNELSDNEKAFIALSVFYPDFENIPPENHQEALKQCFWFIACGENEEQKQKAPKLVDWEHDFKQIVAPINRVMGQEIRALPYLHWWSFIAAYYEIGDCTFAQIVRIRDKKAKGKPLDKSDKEWYNRNRSLVDLPHNYTTAEDEILKQWGA